MFKRYLLSHIDCHYNPLQTSYIIQWFNMIAHAYTNVYFIFSLFINNYHKVDSIFAICSTPAFSPFTDSDRPPPTHTGQVQFRRWAWSFFGHRMVNHAMPCKMQGNGKPMAGSWKENNISKFGKSYLPVGLFHGFSFQECFQSKVLAIDARVFPKSQIGDFGAALWELGTWGINLFGWILAAGKVT